jgi:Cu/Ag efflux pump CusA
VAARFGLNIADVQSIVSTAIGGETIGETIEGRSRFPINVRYPQALRDSLEKLRNLPVVTERGAQIPLSAVARIAIAGVAAEFGAVMLNYLKNAWEGRLATGAVPSRALLIDAIKEGAVLRVRPKAMTVAVILAGLVPILIGSGTGSEVMQRIAAPMIGGMITGPLLSMLIVPAAYLLLRSRGLK